MLSGASQIRRIERGDLEHNFESVEVVRIGFSG
jgi:hypothetical protein